MAYLQAGDLGPAFARPGAQPLFQRRLGRIRVLGHDDYDESIFPTGLLVGTCQDALDTACGLYLNDPTAWTRPPTNLRASVYLHGPCTGR